MPSSSTTTKQSSLLALALNANPIWEDKEQFLDTLYWLRQVVGIVLGIGFGVLGLTGSFALATFVILNAGAGYAYCTGFHGIDEEEYGGPWELVKEGFMTSFAGFLVSWIILYSGLHFD